MADTAAVSAGRPAKRRSRGLPERRLAVFMVAPSVALIAIVALWPIIYAVWLSLHQYSLVEAGLTRWAVGDARHLHLHDRLGDPRDDHRPRHGDGHALGVQGPGPPPHRRAGAVGGPH